MKQEYDFSKSIQNPYAKKTQDKVSVDVDIDTIEYFKELAKKMGSSYQVLINSFLTDCAKQGIEPKLKHSS